MITATDDRVWDVTCDRCHRIDWPTAPTEEAALQSMRADGWRTGPEVCTTCQADEGLTDAELVGSYMSSPAEGMPAPWDRSGL